MNNLMEYKGYHGKVEFSGAENAFVGRVIDIDGTITFTGTSIAELEKAMKTAVDGYLEWCAQIGKTPAKEYKGSFNVRIPSELHRDAAITAAEKGITLNQFVAEAIKEKLQRF